MKSLKHLSGIMGMIMEHNFSQVQSAELTTLNSELITLN